MEQQALFELPAVAEPAATRPAGTGGPRSRAAQHRAGVGQPTVGLGSPLALDEVQQAAIAHRSGGLLVLGGPGTGKTTTVVEVAAARARCGPAQRVLVLVATRAGAAAMRARIGARMGSGALPTVATFHSFALAAYRACQTPVAGGGSTATRLLTAAEQESRLRELLTEAVAAGRVAWPEELRGALGTRGIVAAVRTLLARARGFGMDGATLAGLGRRHGFPAWRALGPFLEEYLDTLGFEGVIDYQELVHQVMVLAHQPREGAALRERFDLIVVDEFQDIEPAQVATLAALARAGADVVAVGDPDQAMYGFRGGGLRGTTTFPARFSSNPGVPAPVLVLRHARASAPAIMAAAARVRPPVTLAPLPASVLKGLRSLKLAGPEGARAGQVVCELYPSAAAEAAGIADRLVRAHAAGVAWAEMAVVVRTPAGVVERLRHSLTAAGVPVRVQVGDLPLGEQPAVAGLLDLLAGAAALREPQSPPAGAPAAAELLCGPVGGLDRASCGLLARELVRCAAIADSAQGSAPGCPAQPAAALAWALAHPGQASDLLAAAVAPGAAASEGAGSGVAGPPDRLLGSWNAAISRVGSALGSGADALVAGGHPAAALWAIWAATDWPERLRTQALAGGPTGLQADGDLDAVIALLDLASRLPAQLHGAAGAAGLVRAIQAQEVPIDLRHTYGPQRPAVFVGSVQAAKGRSWSLVVVAGVQDGVWPDLRLRTDLLGADRLGESGITEPVGVADTLVSERRLFYAACTRASRQLVVTAVADGVARPSRFVTELGVPAAQRASTTTGPASPAGVISRLRRLAAHPDPGVARAAQLRLDRLAGLADPAGRALVPLARTENWWFSRPLTTSPPPRTPIALSGSTVAGVRECPLRWFLDRRCGAGTPAGPAIGVGLLIHEAAAVLADIPGSQLPANRAEVLAALRAVLAAGWERLEFPAPYQEQAERQRAERMLGTLVDWHQRAGQEVVAVEHRFDVRLGRPGRQVRLVGAIDRVDRGGDGALRLVDFKTGRSAVTKAAAEIDAQLGVYQVAVRNGALRGRPEAVAGAELIYLSRPQAATGLPTERTQPPLAQPPSWAEELIDEVAGVLASGAYPARPSAACLRCQFEDLCPAVTRSDDEEPEQ